uniref:Uncharacterized protein n=1 Tax=Vitrella brassicaformis TaxID=1169539 RepID=A0A7S1NY92_9ALVE|mmetsp:Transcript_15501/g.36935  ORF Transcript_15501/g.36935 Transcript_15501/m.36935 type:complete len:124 (+) Transcript_15501:72-443(+)
MQAKTEATDGLTRKHYDASTDALFPRHEGRFCFASLACARAQPLTHSVAEVQQIKQIKQSRSRDNFPSGGVEETCLLKDGTIKRATLDSFRGERKVRLSDAHAPKVVLDALSHTVSLVFAYGQ